MFWHLPSCGQLWGDLLNAEGQTLIQNFNIISPITGPRCPEGSRKLRFPDYVTMAQNGGKVVSLTHRPLFTPRKYSWYSFMIEAESTPGPQCDRKEWKISMTPSGIEPATFRFVAQHLNHCATAHYRDAICSLVLKLSRVTRTVRNRNSSGLHKSDRNKTKNLATYENRHSTKSFLSCFVLE